MVDTVYNTEGSFVNYNASVRHSREAASAQHVLAHSICMQAKQYEKELETNAIFIGQSTFI